MINNPKIVIFSSPIHTGKSSTLEKFSSNRQDISGILCPEVEGKKAVKFLPQSDYIFLETTNTRAENTIIVGNYKFDASVMQQISEFISIIEIEKWNIIIIDEIGKLELMDRGYEPGLSYFLKNFKESKFQTLLILVVRDSLVRDVIEKYKIEHTNIVYTPDDLYRYFTKSLR
ncbi:MAG: nucleoside-triphosphatase [Saprospiraceae bacterium]